MGRLGGVSERDHRDGRVPPVTLSHLRAPAGIETEPNGSFELWTQLIDDVADLKDSMTVLGFVLVLVTLLVVYRKVDASPPLLPIIATFGSTTVIAVGYSLIGTIVLMPAALAVVDRARARLLPQQETVPGSATTV